MSGSTKSEHDLDGMKRALHALDGQAEDHDEFPEGLWSILAAGRAPLWSIPAEIGGDELGRVDLMRRYAEVAEGSLAAAFILSQHDAAVRRLTASPKSEIARRWLSGIVAGRCFATIGVSQLTTSRRLGTRALEAEPQPDGGHLLHGSMPWVTAAERADVFVTGAVRPDGLQILLALPRDRSGLRVESAFRLAALGASRTAEVVCDSVRIEPEDLLVPPSTDVMAHASAAGTGGLETSALALGQARAALMAIEAQRDSLGDLSEPIEALKTEWESAWNALEAAAVGGPGAPGSASVRARSNGLALRTSQAYLTARRGRGFLAGDPAQRWARQALFFLVWSCPVPVANAAIRELAGLCSLS